MSLVNLGLNPAQAQAVRYLDGPALVLAGAGSGKTRVITQKIAYLIGDCAYSANRIIALTFTNKAAREMAERVQAVLEKRQTKGLTISTFHSLGLKILREEAESAGLKPRFSIMDSNDTLGIIQEILATTDKGRLRAVQQDISLWKNALLNPDAAAQAVLTPSQAESAKIYRSYDETLRAYQAVDFDDLIRLPTQLLESNPEVRQRWQDRVHYLLVDEYQDTNTCQYRLVQALVGSRAMFTAVGDDDQAIYAWRGATVENLHQLTVDYPQLKLIKLEQNYRSSQRILEAANNVIGHNPVVFGKKLWSELGIGEGIVIKDCDDEQAEMQWVGISLSAEKFERKAKWGDFAVLYRSNQQARLIEQQLRDLRIPYVISGGQSFFDKAEIRDVLAYIRLIANHDDDPAFIRAATTPRRGIGQNTLTQLGTVAMEHKISMFEAIDAIALTGLLAERQLKPLQVFAEFIRRIRLKAEKTGREGAKILDELLSAINYEGYLYDMFDDRPALARWQNVLELVDWLKSKAEQDDMSLLDLSQHVALITMLERNDQDDEIDAVHLSTLHAAKGLEYKHVFLIGVEEGLLPHMGREDEDIPVGQEEIVLTQRIQEERRLMYVGITRAQRSLRLSWCKRRRRGKEYTVREKSRFINEMGLAETAIVEKAQAHLSPKERLNMLKDLLKQ